MPKDEAVIREENGGYITLSRFYFIRAWRARLRIQSRRSPGAFFANFHPGFASSLPVAFGSIYRATYTISPHFSFAPSPIVSQLASRINDGTGRRPLVAVDNSRFRISFVHILALCLRSPNNQSRARQAFGILARIRVWTMHSSAACLSCRARLMSQEFRAFYRRQRGALSATGFEHAIAF